MIRSATIDEQLRAVESDEPHILIVGAGIAGITLAQLLRARGMHPVLIDRSADAERMTGDNRAGYMLALMPMVDPVIDELGCREDYQEASVGIDRYIAHSHTGTVLREDHLGELLAEYGDYRGISRAELLTVLTGDDCPISFGVTIAGLSDDGAETLVTWSGRGRADGAPVRTGFDVVVIADGMNSRTRRLVHNCSDGPGGHVYEAADGPETAADTVDTTWGGWVCWADADEDSSAVDEIWGDGFFLGMYPVKDGIGVFLGCPDTRQPLGPARFAKEVRGKLTDLTPRVDRCLEAIANADDPFFWPLRDSRAGRWARGRTVLLGDAAAGFLPTAGIGAGMAMESAGALAAELHTVARGHGEGSEAVDPRTLADLPAALERFESRQRPRVEAAHDNSRSLARLMFGRSLFFAAVRDQLFRFVSLKAALKPIITLLDSPTGRM